ncbi:MAG: preprotein translocase subunit SecG [Paludibacteraceae bacterium]
MSVLAGVLTGIIILVAVLLTLVVLVQNSKGGGLASSFQSSNQIMGVKRTTEFIEKATWALAGVLIVLSIIVVGIQSNKQQVGNDSEIKEQSLDLNNQMQKNTAAPNFGEAPAQQQQQQQAAPAQKPAEQPAKK